jgi:hypothetical protein
MSERLEPNGISINLSIDRSLSVQRTAFPAKRVNHHHDNQPITTAIDRYVIHLPVPMIHETIYGKDDIKSLGMLKSKE